MVRMYDTRDDFDCLEEKGIEPGIKVRRIVLRGHGAVLLVRKLFWSLKSLAMLDGRLRRDTGRDGSLKRSFLDLKGCLVSLQERKLSGT